MRSFSASTRSRSDGSDFASASACSASSTRPSSSSASARATAFSAADGNSFSKNARTWLSGSAPTNCATGRPSLNAITLGMERMLKAPAISGLSSELTLTSFTRPANSAATFSMIGPSVRHGPHHGAQKSTTTGSRLEASRTSCSNVAVVTSIDAPSRLAARGASDEPGAFRPAAALTDAKYSARSGTAAPGPAATPSVVLGVLTRVAAYAVGPVFRVVQLDLLGRGAEQVDVTPVRGTQWVDEDIGKLEPYLRSLLLVERRAFVLGQPLEELEQLAGLRGERHREILRGVEALPIPLGREPAQARLKPLELVVARHAVNLPESASSALRSARAFARS